MKITIKKYVHAALVIVSLIGGASVPAIANSETSYQVINYLPQLPNFPQYTGTYKVLRAVVMPQSWGGATYGISFECRETPQMVYDWYADVLRGEKWAVETKAGNGRIDASKKNGNLVRVHVSGKGLGDMRSTVMIEYRIVKAVGIDGVDESSDESKEHRQHE